MKRVLFLSLAIGVINIFQFLTPPLEVGAAATATFGQRILPGNCYDTIVQNVQSVDYIAAFECPTQRPPGI